MSTPARHVVTVVLILVAASILAALPWARCPSSSSGCLESLPIILMPHLLLLSCTGQTQVRAIITVSTEAVTARAVQSAHFVAWFDPNGFAAPSVAAVLHVGYLGGLLLQEVVTGCRGQAVPQNQCPFQVRQGKAAAWALQLVQPMLSHLVLEVALQACQAEAVVTRESGAAIHHVVIGADRAGEHGLTPRCLILFLLQTPGQHGIVVDVLRRKPPCHRQEAGWGGAPNR